MPVQTKNVDLSEANRLEGAGKLSEAERACRQALSAAPDEPRALHLLGTILHRLGRNDEALELLRRAAELAPRKFAYRSNLAAVLGRLGRPADALPHLQAAVQLQPSSPEAHNNLGAALEQLDRLPEAVQELRKAVQLRPSYPEAWYNLGSVQRKAGRVAAAVVAYQRAVRFKPDYLDALSQIPNLLIELGDAEQTISCCRRIVELRPDLASARSALLYTLHYSHRLDSEALSKEHREWGRLFCDPLLETIAPHQKDRDPHRRLRVGYVSPDLREHTVPKFITAAIEHHDHANFELYCYSDAQKADAVTERLKPMVEHWHETRALNDQQLEEIIRSDRIDILVDLRGHAADNRLTLFARKPAPIQVNIVGYFNTTGLSTMDYRIIDEHQDPPGMTEQFHTEQLVRLPHSCWCYTADEDAPDVTEPPALKNGYVTFGSLNKIVKVSEPCAKLWARVLDAVPGSRLVLSVAQAASNAPTLPARGQSPNPLASPGAGFPPMNRRELLPGEGEVKEAAPQESQPRAAVPHNCSVRDRLSQLGLPVDRVELLGKTATRRQYLERFDRIDIALDTFPFNGITTTCDGLWQGVPCVSLAGGTSVSRAGRSILRAANVSELATGTPEAFIRKAVELATDLDRLRELRLSMRKRLLASPLMDHVGFARNFEIAYRQMWRAWCGRP